MLHYLSFLVYLYVVLIFHLAEQRRGEERRGVTLSCDDDLEDRFPLFWIHHPIKSQLQSITIAFAPRPKLRLDCGIISGKITFTTFEPLLNFNGQQRSRIYLSKS